MWVSCGVAGSLSGTAQKKFMAMRATKSGATRVSLMLSLSPSTVTPEAWVAFLFTTASAPTTSLRNVTAGDWSAGARSRSITCANVCAVTSSPVLNLKPLRMVKV